MKLTTNLFLSTLTLAVSVGLSGCDQKPAVETPETAETPTTEAKENSEASETATGEIIRIASEGAYPPLNFTNADGSLGGFDIDVANALCDQMKANCELIAQEWEGIIPGLQAEKYDAIIAGMSITDERKKVVDFTDPYFSSGLMLITKADSDVNIDNIDGKKVGAQKATMASAYLDESKPAAELKIYDTQEAVNSDLLNGRLDAILVDQVVGTAWLGGDSEDTKGFTQKGATISTGKDDMGIAVRKGDALASKFNTALTEIKANGTYEVISAKYFNNGTTTEETPVSEEPVSEEPVSEEPVVAEQVSEDKA